MRIVSRYLLALLAAALGFVLGRSWALAPPFGLGQTNHTGLTIEQIQPLSSLVTARIDVADVVETTLTGYTGAMKVAILVKGDFLLGIDLSQARFESIDSKRRTAILMLPQPHIQSPRVDHSRTRVFAMNTSGLWQIVPGDEGRSALINRAYADAQQIVASAADDQTLLERSRGQAESMLRAFFTALAWEVEIRWSG